MTKSTAKTFRSKAFTLVELLVVIGIIAVLIGILLPSLNKARQQANLIKCQSNLRGIGQALSIYESENNSMMPLGEIDRPPRPGDMEPQWYWPFALGNYLSRNMIGTDGLVHNLSKIFSDLDTIEGHDFRWVSHYTCNPRLFYYPGEYTFGTKAKPLDVFHNPLYLNRKVTNVRKTANVFTVWDGAQAIDQSYNVYPVSQGIDGFGFYFTGLCFSNINGIDVQASLPILPNDLGDPGVENGRAAQKQYNVDSDSAYGTGNPPWQSLRFRHVGNTRLAALCLDGHVETRAVGTVTRNDIYTIPPLTAFRLPSMVATMEILPSPSPRRPGCRKESAPCTYIRVPLASSSRTMLSPALFRRT